MIINKSEHILCVEIGGSHILSGVYDSAGNTSFAGISRRSVKSLGKKEEILDAWFSCIDETLHKVNAIPTGVYIGMPGPFDYENGISYIKNLGKYDDLYETNIKELIAKRYLLPQDVIFFENDATCFLVGQVELIDGLKENKVVGLTLGTGLGACLYEHGRCKDLDLGKEPFMKGITEDYLSTRGFMRLYKQAGGERQSTVKEVMEDQQYCTFARDTIAQFGTYLADFIAQYYGTYQMGSLIIGGGIANGASTFLDITKQQLYTKNIDIPIYLAIDSAEATLLGVWHAMRENLVC
jgi:glucokinase